MRTVAAALLAAACGVPVSAATLGYRYVTEWGSEGDGKGEFEGLTDIDYDPHVYYHYGLDHELDRCQKLDLRGDYKRQWGSEGSGDGQLYEAGGLAVDPTGRHICIADTGNHRVQVFGMGGLYLGQWGTQGTANGQFQFPVGIDALDGTVWVADTGNHRVQRFDDDGTHVMTWGSFGSGVGELNSPAGLVWDGEWTVYVADTGNNRIGEFVTDGLPIGTFGTAGSGDGQFAGPEDIVMNSDGDLIVADTGNHRVQVLEDDGTFVTKFGSFGSGPGQFNSPKAVMVDGDDNVYVADSGNHRIQKFEPIASQGVGTLTWLGGTGYDGQDGCNPDSGVANSTVFKFKVTYTDVGGDEPVKTDLVYRRMGPAWKFYRRVMRPGSGPVTRGRRYWRNIRLPAGNYQYRFEFEDNDGLATGRPTTWTKGPIIRSRPYLTWTGASGYTDDGVKPNTGTAGYTTFRFRARYYDYDGDMPEYVKARIWRNGAPYRKVDMTTIDLTPDPLTGITYRYDTTLPSGTYQYRFLGADDDGACVGPAHEWTVGPIVGDGSAGLRVAGLSAVPTAAGAQVAFSLSTPASVQARVLNIAGRPVKTICTARECEAGANTLLWNATSDAGVTVPNGMYLVEVTGRAEGGGEARALTRVMLRR